MNQSEFRFSSRILAYADQAGSNSSTSTKRTSIDTEPRASFSSVSSVSTRSNHVTWKEHVGTDTELQNSQTRMTPIPERVIHDEWESPTKRSLRKVKSSMALYSEPLRAKISQVFDSPKRTDDPDTVQQLSPRSLLDSSSIFTRSFRTRHAKKSGSASVQEVHSSPIDIPHALEVDISTSPFMIPQPDDEAVEDLSMCTTGRPPEYAPLWKRRQQWPAPMQIALQPRTLSISGKTLDMDLVASEASKLDGLITPMPGTNLTLEDPYTDSNYLSSHGNTGLFLPPGKYLGPGLAAESKTVMIDSNGYLIDSVGAGGDGFTEPVSSLIGGAQNKGTQVHNVHRKPELSFGDALNVRGATHERTTVDSYFDNCQDSAMVLVDEGKHAIVSHSRPPILHTDSLGKDLSRLDFETSRTSDVELIMTSAAQSFQISEGATDAGTSPQYYPSMGSRETWERKRELQNQKYKNIYEASGNSSEDSDDSSDPHTTGILDPAPLVRTGAGAFKDQATGNDDYEDAEVIMGIEPDVATYKPGVCPIHQDLRYAVEAIDRVSGDCLISSPSSPDPGTNLTPGFTHKSRGLTEENADVENVKSTSRFRRSSSTYADDLDSNHLDESIQLDQPAASQRLRRSSSVCAPEGDVTGEKDQTNLVMTMAGDITVTANKAFNHLEGANPVSGDSSKLPFRAISLTAEEMKFLAAFESSTVAVQKLHRGRSRMSKTKKAVKGLLEAEYDIKGQLPAPTPAWSRSKSASPRKSAPFHADGQAGIKEYPSTCDTGRSGNEQDTVEYGDSDTVGANPASGPARFPNFGQAVDENKAPNSRSKKTAILETGSLAVLNGPFSTKGGKRDSMMRVPTEHDDAFGVELKRVRSKGF